MKRTFTIRKHANHYSFLVLLLGCIMLLSSAHTSWGQIISQYIETDSGTTPKGIEIWNNTATTLDFSVNNLIIQQGTNGGALSDLSGTLINTGTLAPGEVLVIGTSDMGTYLTNEGLTTVMFKSFGFAFNGDDALAVKYGGVVTDVFGNPGNDPGSAWSGSGVSTANQNIQLISGIVSGNTSGWTDPSIRFETVSTTPSAAGGLAGFGIAPATSGGATPPSIINIVQTPDSDIQSSTTVSVSADVTAGDAAIDHVELRWGTSTGTYPNVISMTQGTGDTYTTDADIPAQADGTTVYYVVYAEDVDSESATSSEQTYSVTDPVMTTLPYSEDFSSDLGDCYVYSVSGPTKTWFHGTGYAYMNGYNSGDIEEDWMILPGINLDNYNDEILSFDSWKRFGSDDVDNYLKLYYSTDYEGIGSPVAASWTELAFTMPSSEQEWISSGAIDLSGISGTSVWIAFKYRYTSGNYRLWQIDNISIEEDPDPALTANPGTLSGFSYVQGSGPSVSQSFELSGANLTGANVTLTAPANYEISLDNTSFATSQTLTSFNGTATSIYVRLKAGLGTGDYDGETISISGGGAAGINVILNGTVAPPPPGLPYTQNFSGFVSTATLPDGWGVSNTTYAGDWGTGTSAGLRGNASVLGFQHTSSTGLFTATLTLLNNTGETINALDISYMGKVERASEGRLPEWTVRLNGDEIAALFYSTAGGIDAERGTILTGLNIGSGDTFTITWSSDRGGPSGSSRQIGISDVEVKAVSTDPILSANPSTLSGFSYAEGFGPSASQSFQLSGNFLDGTNVTVTAPASYEVSLDNAGFGSSRTLSAYSGAETTVYVRLKAGLSAASYNNQMLSVTGGGAAEINLTLNAYVTGILALPYENPFRTSTDNNDAVFAGFVINNANNETGAGGYLRIYPDGYLESPVIDFTLYDYIALQFDATTYGGDQGQELSVLISGDNGTSYTPLESYLITGEYISYDLIIDVSGTFNTAQGKIRVEMSDGGASTRIRDYSLEEYEIVPTLTFTPASLSGFSYMEGSGPSASQSFELSGIYLSGGNVVIGAPSGYEVSLNNSTFASSRTLTAYSGDPVTLYVRLRAGLEAGSYSSRRITAAGGDANPVYLALSGQVNAPSPGLPYVQVFGGFTEWSGLPSEWLLDKDNYTYGGDFGTGTSGGLRGNGVLGFQLTASAPNNTFQTTLSLQNNTGSTLTELAVAYTGKVERVTETGTPKWVVSVNGTEYSQLEYNTAAGTDQRISHTITGLSIPNGAPIEIAWYTTSDGTSGTRRQIGIADVQIGEQFTGPQILASPTSVSGLSYGLNYGPSPATSVQINGINLSPAQGQLNLMAPSAFQVSLDNVVFRSQISLPYTEESLSITVYVRMREGLDAGVHSGNITVSGGGASTLQIQVSGNVIGPPGLPYAQDFSGFVYPASSSIPYFGGNFEWTFASSGTLGDYLGDWGIGTSGGFRGNSNVLGYQHTSGTGTMTAMLTLKNDSDLPIYKMRIAYTGRVARVSEGRSPEWQVALNGEEVPGLAYSTMEGTDQNKEVTLSGLSIAPGAYFTISWESSRGEPAGASKQIGISNVEVEAIDVTVPVTFMVSDGENPIQNAGIHVGGYQLQTNAQGVAVANLPPGNYLYDVTAYTYEPLLEEELTVGEMPFEVPVILTEEAFFVLTLPWNEDFDLGFPARGWRRYQLGTSAQGIQWAASDDAYSGALAAYHKYTERAERADSWLVSPPVELPADDLIHMTFYEKNHYMARYYTYSGVWISTADGDPASGDFIEMHESSAAHDDYTEVSLDLSAYAGETVYLAFVYQGAYGHDWWVDDISVVSSIPSYMVELTADPESAGSVSGAGEYTRGEQLTISAEPEPAFYFAGWYDTAGELFSESAEYTFPMPGHALDLTAVFETRTFILEASASAGGSISPSGTIHVTYGDHQVFDFEVEQGYEIVDVLVDGESVGSPAQYAFTDIQSDHTIAVEFGWKHFTISAGSTAGGTLSPAGDVRVPYMGMQTFEIIPDAGYVIHEVYVDDVAVGSVGSYTFENVASEHEIFVEFEITSFSIVAEAGEGGSISPSGELILPYGSSQLFDIVADAGHHIVDVSVDGESMGAIAEYTFSDIQADHSIQATFAPNTYVITSTATAGGSISPSGETEVLHGQRQTYLIIPQPGYSIVYVEVDGVRKGSPASYTFESVDRDHHIHASFAKAYYPLTLQAMPAAGGHVIGQGYYALGASVMVYARASEGYHFEKWTDNTGEVVSTSAVYRFSMPAYARELTAHFVEQAYQLNLIARPENGGSVYGAGTYAQGAVVDIEAVPNEGYEFVNWTVPGGMVFSEEAAFTYVMPPLNIEMRANFTIAENGGKQAETKAEEEMPLSAGESLSLMSIKLFPNPARGTLYVESSEMIEQLRILDISGRVLYAATVDNYTYQLNVSGMNTGLYFVQLLTGKGWLTERLQVVTH